MRSASCPNTQTPIIIPTTVTAVHSPDFVSEKPICFDRKVGSQIMIP